MYKLLWEFKGWSIFMLVEKVSKVIFLYQFWRYNLYCILCVIEYYKVVVFEGNIQKGFYRDVVI